MSKVLIGMPNIGGIPPKTVASLLQLVKRINPQVIFLSSSLIYDARNDIALEAINGGYDELLFIDSDLVFPDDCYEKLKALDADIATGIYYGRAGKHNPIVYREVKRLEAITDGADTIIHPAEAKHFETIPEGTFEIAACGMGMCLIKVDVLKKLCKTWTNKPFEPCDGLGEDLAFCYRAKQAGFKIKANSYIPLGHIGEKVYTKEDYK
ncbi:MAG: hypothetical protein J6Y09_06640 [Lachnospiraceae bacterium]|nr:hypothetical protein [Lachnospiraceae bacterium]